MYKERILLIDRQMFNQLKKQIKTEEQYYAFLKKEGVTGIAIYNPDDTLVWVGKYDFICD